MTQQVLTGVGAELKRAREAGGLAVGEVAERLKLLPRQVESLEGERFDRLPGPAIARGMVRNYARLLNLDPEPLVARMMPPGEKAPERPVVPRHREPMPSSSTRRSSTLLYAGFSVVLLVAIAAFGYQWHHKEAEPALVAPVERPSPPLIEQKPAEKPVDRPVEQPTAKEEPPAAPAPAEPPSEPKLEAAPAPAPGPGVRLVLRIEQDAWVEVRDSEGRNLLSSLNPAGSERVVRGQPPFQVVIGNAPHVKLTYDGKPVDLAPHTKGEVARFTLR